MCVSSDETAKERSDDVSKASRDKEARAYGSAQFGNVVRSRPKFLKPFLQYGMEMGMEMGMVIGFVCVCVCVCVYSGPVTHCCIRILGEVQQGSLACHIAHPHRVGSRMSVHMHILQFDKQHVA